MQELINFLFKYLPLFFTAVDMLMALCCLFVKDFPRFYYWLSAAVLTFSTTKMK